MAVTSPPPRLLQGARDSRDESGQSSPCLLCGLEPLATLQSPHKMINQRSKDRFRAVTLVEQNMKERTNCDLTKSLLAFGTALFSAPHAFSLSLIPTESGELEPGTDSCGGAASWGRGGAVF